MEDDAPTAPNNQRRAANEADLPHSSALLDQGSEQDAVLATEEKGDEEDEEADEMTGAVESAPVAQQSTKKAIKNSAEATVSGSTAQFKKGRKPGGPKKPPQPSWTVQEDIALLKVYINNPKLQHKEVAARLTSDFWAGTQHERTGASCTQRMTAKIKAKTGDPASRDKSVLPSVLADLEATLARGAGGVNDGEDDDVEEDEEEAEEVNEAAGPDDESAYGNGETSEAEGDDIDNALEPSGELSAEQVFMNGLSEEEIAAGVNGVDRISVVYFPLRRWDNN